MSDVFYPNKIKIDELDGLEPWQLLVAACHFGPLMGDCVSLNYGYEIKKVLDFDTMEREDHIFVIDNGSGVDIEPDVSMAKKEECLLHHAVRSWKDFAKDCIEKGLRKLDPSGEQMYQAAVLGSDYDPGEVEDEVHKPL